MSPQEPPPITDKKPQDLLVDDPIYTVYSKKDIPDEIIYELVINGGTVQGYCTECEQPSTFETESSIGGVWMSEDDKKAKQKFSYQDVVTTKAKCVRKSHSDNTLKRCSGFVAATFAISSPGVWEITKIGQYPSKAEADFATLPIYFKELGEADRREYGTAVGLHAHGVGIGSFVYLRRIFERLIKKAAKQAEQSESFDKQAYQNARLKDKILLVKDHLPTRLVKQRDMYSILSKGIHELEEAECLTHFSLICQGIRSILSQIHEEKESDRVADEIKKTASQHKAAAPDQ